MPKMIGESDRHMASRKAQMEMLVGSPDQWFRIDKGDGSILPVDSVAVVRAARGAFTTPNHAIATGRFATNWAIYCSGDRMTEAEKAAALA